MEPQSQSFSIFPFLQTNFINQLHFVSAFHIPVNQKSSLHNFLMLLNHYILINNLCPWGQLIPTVFQFYIYVKLRKQLNGKKYSQEKGQDLFANKKYSGSAMSQQSGWQCYVLENTNPVFHGLLETLTTSRSMELQGRLKGPVDYSTFSIRGCLFLLMISNILLL